MDGVCVVVVTETNVVGTVEGGGGGGAVSEDDDVDVVDELLEGVENAMVDGSSSGMFLVVEEVKACDVDEGKTVTILVVVPAIVEEVKLCEEVGVEEGRTVMIRVVVPGTGAAGNVMKTVCLGGRVTTTVVMFVWIVTVVAERAGIGMLVV